jgi:hypothetical protein
MECQRDSEESGDWCADPALLISSYCLPAYFYCDSIDFTDCCRSTIYYIYT